MITYFCYFWYPSESYIEQWTCSGDTPQGRRPKFLTKSNNIHQAQETNRFNFGTIITIVFDKCIHLRLNSLHYLQKRMFQLMTCLISLVLFIPKLFKLSNDKELREITVPNKIIFNEEKHWIIRIHDLYYTWVFFAWIYLNIDTPFYSFLD